MGGSPAGRVRVEVYRPAEVPPAAPVRAERWLAARALRNAALLAALFSAVVAAVVLFRLDGWSYYRTPIATRGYAHAHKLLRPAGAVGQALGMAGFLMMLTTLLYSVRKNFRPFSRLGSTRIWLEIHIFCGVAGPVLITLHTSFRFNGIVSVAYWSMVIVVLSGFVGRYLYVRIPRTLRGTELSLEELESRALQLKSELAVRGLPSPLLRRIEAFETADHGRGFLLGDLRLRRGLAHLLRDLAAAGADPAGLKAAESLIRERAVLLRRIATLDVSKRLFHLWHVFHQPFVYVTLGVAFLHVAVALYFGYARRW